MKKAAVSMVAFVSLFAAGAASAQTYSYTYASGACTSLTSDLSVGSRGSEVSDLQRFLVAQNYPGGGSWMITGYFGQATLAALRNFQQTAGLPATGFLDAQTRAAILSRSCGGYSAPALATPAYSYNYNYSTPAYPYTSYPYSYSGYPYTYGSLTLTSLSANTAVPGTSVTVYGTGFDAVGNTVYLGSSVVASAPSDGTSLTFVVPAYFSLGSTQLKVSNSRGTSNTLSFTVVATPYSCGTMYGGYYGSTCNACAIGTTCDGHSGAPLVASITPVSGSVGTNVTIYGSGFTSSGNTVHFGNGLITNLNSMDGRGLSFTVPTTLTGYGAQQIAIGTYPVSVTNGRGERSNTVNFSVTSTAGSTGAPVIGSISGPNSINVGVQGTWSVSINAPAGAYLTTTVRWGDEGVYGGLSAQPQTLLLSGQQTFSFTHTYLTPGSYTITFTVSSAGGTNASTATVTVGSGASSVVSLSSVSPNSGTVGTQVLLTGTGFTGDNTVHFGVGGIAHAVSQSGTYINFTIPSHISPCDLLGTGYACGAPVQAVTPGSYPVYVTNSNGATNILYFSVL